jgi:hypothetical protein
MKPFAQAVGEMRALGLDGDAPTVESAPSAVRYQLGDDPDSNPLVYADASCFGPSPGESVLPCIRCREGEDVQVLARILEIWIDREREREIDLSQH